MQHELPELDGVSFRPIPSCPGYMVGDNGTVWSNFLAGGRGGFTSEWRQMSTHRRPYGSRYVVVCLRADLGKGKVVCRYVHRLVLEAFAGPCPPGMQGCHEDGDTANNHLANLRWDTASANAEDKRRHGTMPMGVNHRNSKLTPDTVREARRLRAEGWTQQRLADKFGVNQVTMRKALCGDTWRHVADLVPAGCLDDLDPPGADAGRSGLAYQDEHGEPTVGELAWLRATG